MKFPSTTQKSRASSSAPKQKLPDRVLEIGIALKCSDPEIWRMVLIGPDTSFLELHYSIQFAMGWTNSHLHQFIIGNEDEYIGVGPGGWGSEIELT